MERWRGEGWGEKMEVERWREGRRESCGVGEREGN